MFLFLGRRAEILETTGVSTTLGPLISQPPYRASSSPEDEAWLQAESFPLAGPSCLHQTDRQGVCLCARPCAEHADGIPNPHQAPCLWKAWQGCQYPPCARVCVKSLLSCLTLCIPMAPPSMGFSRQEYWRGLPCPPPGIFPTQGSNPHPLCLLHWQVGSLPLVSPGKPSTHHIQQRKWIRLWKRGARHLRRKSGGPGLPMGYSLHLML